MAARRVMSHRVPVCSAGVLRWARSISVRRGGVRAADPLVRGRVVRANVSLATSCGSHGIMARVPGVEVSSSAPRLFVPPVLLPVRAPVPF